MDEQVLVWAVGRDGPLTCTFLQEAGFGCQACPSLEDLLAAIEGGPGLVVLAAELLSADAVSALEQVLERQPPWSDLPLVIVVGSEPMPGARDPFETLGNVSLLHRPLSLDTLTTTVRAALRARRRQYQVRDLLRQREESERRKDEFLAMLAHELRNPLGPIRTGIQVLRLVPSPEAAERTRAMMERQVTNLIRLVDDLLDVSRITRGKIVLRKRPVDVAELLAQVAESAVRAASEKGLRLEVHPPPGPLYVEADPTRLEQMVGNLLSNALKFTPAHGVIRLLAAREAGHVVIRVRDTGLGIPPHMLRQVFDLFAQTDRPLDRGQGGLGIGLTVVRSLAELHGGTAQIFSAGEGKGTEVSIHLPALDLIPRAASPARDGDAPATRRQRILIIEDNRDSAEILATYLQAVGHEVAVAWDGPTGVAAAVRQHPDAVLCDIGLPGLDGYGVARALRAEPALASCLLIAITGYGDAADRERALQSGFDNHLTKPADPHEVARLVSAGKPLADGQDREASREHERPESCSSGH